ncbi:hypothetical protein ACHAWF_000340 [Thalassiosira exigua]
MKLPNHFKAALVFAGTAANAFQLSPSSHRVLRRTEPLHVSAEELSPIDEMCIENVAEYCLQEQCDVEEYEALVNQLEEQQRHFERHVAKVKVLLAQLKNSNHPDHDPEEVRGVIDESKEALANGAGESLGLW